MAYTYHGTSNLIALPNRTVQTYPSGLVRVERSFVCRKADVAKNRNTIRVNERMPMDDGAPAFDGLFIFPGPQEIVRDDGFVEFRVTAYGRTTVTGSIETNFEVGGFNYSTIDNQVPQPSTFVSAIIPRYTQKIVLQSSEVSNFSFEIDADFLPISVGMFSTTVQEGQIETAAVNVPYKIWEEYFMTGPSSSGLSYNGFTLFTYGLFSSFPFTSKRRYGFLGAGQITSVNFGVMSEYTIPYRGFFSVDFIKK
jgi:hypothetical protein